MYWFALGIHGVCWNHAMQSPYIKHAICSVSHCEWHACWTYQFLSGSFKGGCGPCQTCANWTIRTSLGVLCPLWYLLAPLLVRSGAPYFGRSEALFYLCHSEALWFRHSEPLFWRNNLCYDSYRLLLWRFYGIMYFLLINLVDCSCCWRYLSLAFTPPYVSLECAFFCHTTFGDHTYV